MMPANWATTNKVTSTRTKQLMVRNHCIWRVRSISSRLRHEFVGIRPCSSIPMPHCRNELMTRTALGRSRASICRYLAIGLPALMRSLVPGVGSRSKRQSSSSRNSSSVRRTIGAAGGGTDAAAAGERLWLGAGAREHLAEQLPRRAVKLLQLHLFDRIEIGSAGRERNAG